MESVFDFFGTLGLDDSNFEEGLNNASSKTEGLSAKTVAVGKIMADAFEAVISKVAEYGAKVIEVGEQQETALAKVNTIMDTSVMNTEAMSSAIKDLSSEMGVSVTELSDTVYNAISATGDTANAVSLAEQASKLATAGFTDTSSALSVLTTAMNAYGLSADEASSISDSLIQVQNLGVTTVAELSSSMGKAIASASAYGVDLGNLESAYVSITKAGINTAEGTTYISSMLKELGDSGSDVSAVLQEKTGKSFDQLMKEGKTLGDVLGVLSDSVNGDQTALMNLWSSAEAGKASSAIVGQGLEEFNANLETIGNTAGATETAYETMADTLEHKMSVFKTTGENLMSALYNGMSGNLGDIVGFGTELISGIANDVELRGMSALPASILDALQQAFTAVSENMDTVLDGVGTVIEGIMVGLGEQDWAFVDAVGGILESVLNFLTSQLPYIVECITYFVGDIASRAGEWLPKLIPMVIELLEGVAQALVDNIHYVIEGAVALLEGLIEGLTEALPELIEYIPTIVQSIVDALIEVAPQLFEASVQIMLMLAEGLIQSIPSLLKAVPKIVVALLAGFLELKVKMREAGVNLVKGLWEGFKEQWSKFTAWIESVLGDVVDAVKDFFGIHSPSTVFAEIGGNLAKGMQVGWDDEIGAVKDSLTSDMDFSATPAKMSTLFTDSGSLATPNINTNVTVTLEGDARKLFKMMQKESINYNKTTGQQAFA